MRFYAERPKRRPSPYIFKPPSLSAHIGVIGLCVLALTACGPSRIAQPILPHPVYRTEEAPKVLSQNDTVDLESADRIKRFQKLATIEGIPPPTIEEMTAPADTMPGAKFPVPVVRVVFDQRVFFDNDSVVPLPQVERVLEIIAENMHLDVPDAALTILGHTDSNGADAYNIGLSERRALYVMRLLSAKSVDPFQMTTVAIGERQPLDSNATPEGRSRNRRVEFMISASVRANLAVVQQRQINPQFLPPFRRDTVLPPDQTSARVLQSQTLEIRGSSQLALVPIGDLRLQPAPITTADVAPKPVVAAPPVTLRPLRDVKPANLSGIVVE